MSVPRAARLLLASLLLATHALPAEAQSRDAARLAVTAAEPMARADSSRRGVTGTLQGAVERLPLWSAPIASAILPGLGQYRLKRDRFVAFAAVEAFLIIQYAKNNGEGEGSARNYRALARDVSRRTFPGTHPDTIFEYYEAMSKHIESGDFSKAITGPTVPETDPATFNGKQWILAREQFGVDLVAGGPSSPNYADALAYYESRAIPQAYGWTWRNAQLEQDLFRREIARSNDAYVRARRNLSALIANHLLSAIDAFASVRLIQAAGGETRISASIPVR
jgi:hypothetical protein